MIVPDRAGRRHWHNICSLSYLIWSRLPNELQHAICEYLVVKIFSLEKRLHIWLPIHVGYFPKYMLPLQPMHTINFNYFTPTPVAVFNPDSKKQRKKAITTKWQRRQQQWQKQNKRWK
jgi:hypothetical protein